MCSLTQHLQEVLIASTIPSWQHSACMFSIVAAEPPPPPPPPPPRLYSLLASFPGHSPPKSHSSGGSGLGTRLIVCQVVDNKHYDPFCMDHFYLCSLPQLLLAADTAAYLSILIIQGYFIEPTSLFLPRSPRLAFH